MRGWTFVVIAALALSGCGKQPVACTAESAQSPVVSIVKEQIEKLVSAKLRGDEGTRSVGLSKIRAAVGQLVIGLDDIRTSKEDPNSTRRFCRASLNIRFPSDMLVDADKAREASDLTSVSDLAADGDVERNADRFSSEIEFNVQPTDDGSKVFAETESGNGMFDFAAEVLASGLMRAAIDDARRAEAQAAQAEASAQNAALSEQREANVAAARLDNQLATQTIGAAWKTLPSATRAQLLPAQRVWIRKKGADCVVEAASVSTDPAEREVARLNCDTRFTQERIAWLAQYRTSDGVDPPLSEPADQPLDQDL